MSISRLFSIWGEVCKVLGRPGELGHREGWGHGGFPGSCKPHLTQPTLACGVQGRANCAGFLWGCSAELGKRPEPGATKGFERPSDYR